VYDTVLCITETFDKYM